MKIRPPVGWQLEQYRSEPVLEDADPPEKGCNTLLRLFQFLHMSDVAAGLGGEYETRWCGVTPMSERCFTGQVVKRVVDFHALEMLHVVCQPVLLGQVVGKESAMPMIIGPAGGADEYTVVHDGDDQILTLFRK